VLRMLRLAVAAGLLAAATLGVTAGGVAAYGHADGPLAQIEWSGNCDNPTFPLCAPPDQGGFGLGGIWLWIEIDGGAGATSGDADVAGAVCFHVRGAAGGGAVSLTGEYDWWWSATPAGFADFGDSLDPNGYYNVDLGPFGVNSFPVSQGHYSSHPAPGVSIQLQVAP
jgi:hypothetical protein